MTGVTAQCGPSKGVHAHGRKLSEQQIVVMAELREKGWSLRRIANYFAARGTTISESALGWQCLRVGADLPPKRRGRNFTPKPIVRNGHPVIPFTPEEDEKLLALEATGATHSQIARQLGRRQNSVRGRLMTLARADARREQVLQ